jgi:hypothetical protein
MRHFDTVDAARAAQREWQARNAGASAASCITPRRPKKKQRGKNTERH